MRIAQVPRRFFRSDWGGTETVILETCKWLLRFGHETEIICPNALAEQDEEYIEGVHVKRISYFYPYSGLDRKAKKQLDRKGGNIFSLELMKVLRRYPELGRYYSPGVFCSGPFPLAGALRDDRVGGDEFQPRSGRIRCGRHSGLAGTRF